jgi:replicative DNA helicase
LDYDKNGLAYDIDLEEATLGSLLVAPKYLKQVLSDCNLRETSFYFEKNKVVFSTIINLFENNVPPTEELVSSQLNGAVPRG